MNFLKRSTLDVWQVSENACVNGSGKRCQDPCKYIKAVNYCFKALLLRCLRESWLYLWVWNCLIALHKKWSFPSGISSVNVTKPADLVTCTEKIRNGNIFSKCETNISVGGFVVTLLFNTRKQEKKSKNKRKKEKDEKSKTLLAWSKRTIPWSRR